MILYITIILFIIFLMLSILGNHVHNKYWNFTDIGYDNPTSPYKTRKELAEAQAKYKETFLYKLNNTYDSYILGGVLITSLMLLIMSGILIGCRTNEMGQGLSNQERQKALEYKVSTEFERDEFGIRNKDIIDEVQAWNEDIAERTAGEHNFWVGVFYPKLVDKYGLHIIELK